MAAVELTGVTDGVRGQSLVVLGASNVSRGLSRLVSLVESRCPGADLFIAAGHGRSYGVNSRIWMRRLPSILHCGLWRALQRQRTSLPMRAIVTDVGNDLLYGFSAEQVAAWVGECLHRLGERGAVTAITRLPMASLARVGRARYRMLRAVFVPGCPLDLGELRRAAFRLDEQLAKIAADCGAVLIDQPEGWYSLDALHIRRRHLDTLWGRACDLWGFPIPAAPVRRSLVRWLAVGGRAAEVRSLCGAMRFTRQPVLRLRNGCRLWLY